MNRFWGLYIALPKARRKVNSQGQQIPQKLALNPQEWKTISTSRSDSDPHVDSDLTHISKAGGGCRLPPEARAQQRSELGMWRLFLVLLHWISRGPCTCSFSGAQFPFLICKMKGCHKCFLERTSCIILNPSISGVEHWGLLCFLTSAFFSAVAYQIWQQCHIHCLQGCLQHSWDKRKHLNCFHCGFCWGEIDNVSLSFPH